MEAFPGDVFELVGEVLEPRAGVQMRERRAERIGADDPHEIKAAQCIEGKQALTREFRSVCG